MRKHSLAAIQREMKELKNLRQEYYNKYGKSPKVSYLASRMGVSAEHVMEVLEAGRKSGGIRFPGDEW